MAPSSGGGVGCSRLRPTGLRAHDFQDGAGLGYRQRLRVFHHGLEGRRGFEAQLFLGLAHNLILKRGTVLLTDADHKGQQTGRPPRCPRSNTNCAGCSGPGARPALPVQGMATFLSVPRPIREAGGRGSVHRTDGCEPQCLGAGSSRRLLPCSGLGGCRGRLHQAGCLRAVGGQHHRVERVCRPRPSRQRCAPGLHALFHRCSAASGLQPLRSGIREQRPQVGARQQQVRATAPAEQAVAQHAQNTTRALACAWGVECRYAQGRQTRPAALRAGFSHSWVRPTSAHRTGSP